MRRIIILSVLFLASASSARAASIVTEWVDDAVPIANEVAWEPTIGARFFAILSTATYDAWTAYDPKAVAVASGTALKNRGGAANEANKREAISHAAYTVLSTLAPQRRGALAARMAELGYEPNATTAPAEVGRSAALAVLAKFREDGANESGGFSDTTGYKTMPGADHWQPILAFDKPQLPTTPQWGRVMPFGLARADQYRPVPPPAPGTESWSHQIAELIEVSGGLTDAQKAAAEFWNEWGSSPAPHLIELTKFVSDLHDLRTDDDIRLFFIVGNTLLDASIATWDAKYFYDYVRPITAIRGLGEVSIRAWRPRSLPAVLAYSSPTTSGAIGAPTVPPGIAEMRATDWQPYLPTPSFPSYVAGHATFCAAWARVMTLATGSPDLDFRKTVKHLYVEQRELTSAVKLDYATYEAAAEACGRSRIWGGVHWPDDIERGWVLGRSVGEASWDRAQQFLLGSATPATAAFATLHSPFWFHQDTDANGGAKYLDGAGLAIDLLPHAQGMWRSIVLDPVPAGAYELRLKVGTTGEVPLRLQVAIRPNEVSRAGATVESDTALPPAGRQGTVTLRWTSDGTQSFAISVKASADAGRAQVLVSAIDLVRVWPVVAGSPRFVEPALAGRSNE